MNSISALTPGPAADGSGGNGGGSSPVVPILIAVGILAVLSAGIAFFNERFRLRR